MGGLSFRGEEGEEGRREGGVHACVRKERREEKEERWREGGREEDPAIDSFEAGRDFVTE